MQENHKLKMRARLNKRARKQKSKKALESFFCARNLSGALPYFFRLPFHHDSGSSYLFTTYVALCLATAL